MKILLNKGHEPDSDRRDYDPGAVYGKLTEATIAGDFVDFLAGYLGEEVPGIEIMKTRNLDVYGDGTGADMVLAFHVNAGGGTGSEVFTHTAAIAETHDMADAILRCLSTTWGMRSRGIKSDVTMPQGYNSDELYCFKRPQERIEMLVELAFIDHEYDRQYLSNPVQLQRLAQDMARGIGAALGKKEPQRSPPHAGQPEYPRYLKAQIAELEAAVASAHAEAEAKVKAMEKAVDWANEKGNGYEHWFRQILAAYFAGPQIAGTEFVSAIERAGEKVREIVGEDPDVDAVVERQVISGSRSNMDIRYPNGWRESVET